jgi:uncharacterized membrane protein
LIPNSTEKLTYRWYALTPEVLELGTDSTIENIKLPVGEITIYIEVSDEAGAEATDFILITVEKAMADTTELSSNSLFLLFIIIIIIVVIVVVLLFIIARKRRKEREMVHPDVIQPVSKPREGAELPPGTVQEAQLTPVVEQAGAQLPMTTAQAPTYSLAQDPASGVEPEFTPEERLKMLEHRLIKGDISEDVYRELKEKIEMEITAAAPGPSPLLPEARAMPEGVTPVSEEEAQVDDQPPEDIPEEAVQEPEVKQPEVQVIEPEVVPPEQPVSPEPEQPEQAQQPLQPPTCATCGQPTTYIEQYGRYYCYQCQIYA